MWAMRMYLRHPGMSEIISVSCHILLHSMSVSLSRPTPKRHPNIYPDGRVCISILHPPGTDRFNEQETADERWRPILGGLCAPCDALPVLLSCSKNFAVHLHVHAQGAAFLASAWKPSVMTSVPVCTCLLHTSIHVFMQAQRSGSEARQRSAQFMHQAEVGLYDERAPPHIRCGDIRTRLRQCSGRTFSRRSVATPPSVRAESLNGVSQTRARDRDLLRRGSRSLRCIPRAAAAELQTCLVSAGSPPILGVCCCDELLLATP